RDKPGHDAQRGRASRSAMIILERSPNRESTSSSWPGRSPTWREVIGHGKVSLKAAVIVGSADAKRQFRHQLPEFSLLADDMPFLRDEISGTFVPSQALYCGCHGRRADGPDDALFALRKTARPGSDHERAHGVRMYPVR